MRRKKFTYLYVILWTVEGIADEYRDILKFLLKQKSLELDRDLLAVLKALGKVAENYSQLFYKYNYFRMQRLKEEISILKREMNKLQGKTKKELWVYLYSILNKYYESLNSIVGYHC